MSRNILFSAGMSRNILSSAGPRRAPLSAHWANDFFAALGCVELRLAGWSATFSGGQQGGDE